MFYFSLTIIHLRREENLCSEGMPHDVLQNDFYVPGCTSRKEADAFKGKPLWDTILQTTPETCVAYFKRATEDCLFHIR